MNDFAKPVIEDIDIVIENDPDGIDDWFVYAQAQIVTSQGSVQTIRSKGSWGIDSEDPEVAEVQLIELQFMLGQLNVDISNFEELAREALSNEGYWFGEPSDD